MLLKKQIPTVAVVFMCCVIGPCSQHYVQLISIVFRIRWESFRVLSGFQLESKGQIGRAPLDFDSLWELI